MMRKVQTGSVGAEIAFSLTGHGDPAIAALPITTQVFLIPGRNLVACEPITRARRSGALNSSSSPVMQAEIKLPSQARETGAAAPVCSSVHSSSSRAGRAK